MAKFKISTDEGTFMVEAPDEETALQAVGQMPPAKPSNLSIARDLYEGTPLGLPHRLGRQAADFLAKNGSQIASDVWQSAKDAYSAPYRAYKGDLPMTDASGRTSDQAISEAFNMAQWITPPSPDQGALSSIPMKKTPQQAAVRDGEEVAQAASRIGVELPRAVTSDSPTVQSLGKKLSQTPLVGTPLRSAYKKAGEQLDDAAKNVQDALGTGSVEVAGNRIRQDVAKFATEDEPANVTVLYEKLKTQIDPNVRVQMSATARVAADIVKKRQAADATPSRAVEMLRAALMRREGKSYEELKTLREDFRRLKDTPAALASQDMDKRQVEDLYEALSADLRAAAKAAGGDEALQTFNEANSRSYLFHRDKKELRKILGEGSDENMATKLTALAGVTSRANIKGLALARSKVSKETWDELASTVVADLARNPTTGEFTPDKFVSKWNNLSPSGKKILFGGEYLKDLEAVAKVSTRMKKMNEFANHSGTGPFTIVGGGALAAGIGAFVDPTIVAGTVLTAAVGRGTSHFLASPKSAKVVADYAKAYELAAKSPSQTTQNLLADKAMALARIAANGNERAASNIAASLATVQKAAADVENDENVGSPEGNPEPDKANQEFNDAYLQGRAL